MKLLKRIRTKIFQLNFERILFIKTVSFPFLQQKIKHKKKKKPKKANKNRKSLISIKTIQY